MSFNVKFDSNLPHLKFFPMVMVLLVLALYCNYFSQKGNTQVSCLFILFSKHVELPLNPLSYFNHRCAKRD